MSDEKNWRVEHLAAEQEKHGKRLDELERFQYSTIEKLKTIFERLKEIEQTNRWVSQSFFYIIFSGAIGAVFTVIVWLVQR